MPGFDGTGPRGMGPMTGGGRGLCSPWGIGANQRMYGNRRGGYPMPYYETYGYGQFAPRITREEELESLKMEAEAMRQELKALEDRLGQLSAKSE